MTKKQIFILTLSAAIFTASSLFAMLDPPERKNTRILRSRKGLFAGLEKELIREIIETTKSGKAVVNFLCTSQEMSQICQPSICKV